MTVPLTCPFFKRRHLDAALSCLASGRIGPAHFSREFADQMACSARMQGAWALRDVGYAFLLALEAEGIEPGSKIIMSALTPSVLRAGASLRGLEILLVDLSCETLQMDLAQIESLLPLRPNAIVFADLLGRHLDVTPLRRFNLPVFSSLRSCAVSGDLPKDGGDYLLLSLEEKDFLPVGGGGLLLTAERGKTRLVKETFVHWPQERALSDLNASLGLAQLKDLMEVQKRRASIASHYDQALKHSHHQPLPREEGDLLLDYPVLIERDIEKARRYAKKHGIQTASTFAGMLDEKFHSREKSTSFPVIEGITHRCVSFPFHAALLSQEIEKVSKVLATLP